jgi:deoxyribonuclease-4
LTPFSSRKDRHAPIGEGSLGLKTFIKIINHPLLKELPFFLETPHELEGHRAEIRLLQMHRKE